MGNDILNSNSDEPDKNDVETVIGQDPLKYDEDFSSEKNQINNSKSIGQVKKLEPDQTHGKGIGYNSEIRRKKKEQEYKKKVEMKIEMKNEKEKEEKQQQQQQSKTQIEPLQNKKIRTNQNKSTPEEKKITDKSQKKRKTVPVGRPSGFYVDGKNKTLVIKEINESDFKKEKVIGKGRFGKVFLVKEKKTGKYYAMKIMKKKYVIKKKSVRHIKTERLLLAGISHPFCINLHYAFHDPEKLFLVMDFVNGGELFYHLRVQGRFPEKRVKIYAAEVLLALEYLHKNNIIHRDLKPENLLVGSDGHLILTDFGLSKVMNSREDKAKTMCGTIDYLAPEMILMSKKKRKGYDHLVDWWGYGILVYECLVGHAPFLGRNLSEIYQNILTQRVRFDEKLGISDEAQDFVKNLLRKHPKNRLGYNSSQEIKDHPWFDDVDWKKLYSKGYKLDWRPTVKDEGDTRFINPTYLEMPIQSLKKPVSQETLKFIEGKFKDWDFDERYGDEKPSSKKRRKKKKKEKSTTENQNEERKNSKKRYTASEITKWKNQ